MSYTYTRTVFVTVISGYYDSVHNEIGSHGKF